MELEYVDVSAYDHYFFNSRSDNIKVLMNNCTFLRSGFKLFASLDTFATVENCVFIGGGSNDYNTGLVFENSGSGYHVITVEGCKFTQHKHSTLDQMKTSSAFSVINKHKDSKLRFIISRSSFMDNCRGIDLSIIGESEVCIS